MISTRIPNNAFILNDSSCCEVTVLGEEADVHHIHTELSLDLRNRISRTLALSCLIGGYKAQLRKACTKVLPVARLEEGNQDENAIFLVIVHAF